MREDEGIGKEKKRRKTKIIPAQGQGERDETGRERHW